MDQIHHQEASKPYEPEDEGQLNIAKARFLIRTAEITLELRVDVVFVSEEEETFFTESPRRSR